MFGRRKNEEDPFAALRDGGSYQSPPSAIADAGVSGFGGQAESTQAAPTPTPEPRAVRSGGGLRRRRNPVAVGFWALLALRLAFPLIVVAVVGVGVARSIHSAVNVPALTFNSGAPAATSEPSPTPATPAQPSPAPSVPVSYLRPAGVRAGLTVVAKLVPGATLTVLRIDGDSLSATATLPNGVVEELYFGPSGTEVLPGAATGERPVPLSEIRPSVVGRLVGEMDRRFHVAADRIDYMVISSPPGLPAQWIVFVKSPSHPGFSATLSGEHLAPLGS
jgi:hypothetical protein